MLCDRNSRVESVLRQAGSLVKDSLLKLELMHQRTGRVCRCPFDVVHKERGVRAATAAAASAATKRASPLAGRRGSFRRDSTSRRRQSSLRW